MINSEDHKEADSRVTTESQHVSERRSPPRRLSHPLQRPSHALLTLAIPGDRGPREPQDPAGISPEPCPDAGEVATPGDTLQVRIGCRTRPCRPEDRQAKDQRCRTTGLVSERSLVEWEGLKINRNDNCYRCCVEKA